MQAELRIIVDVAAYRLRRLEMANLVAAGLIMVALKLSVLEIFVRGLFGALLNLLVYLNNDYIDRDEDLGHAGRDQARTTFLHEHPGAAVRSQLGLLSLLLALALFWGGSLPWALIVGGGVCWAYSAWLKRTPGADIPAMVVWGMAMPSVALPPDTPAAGWYLLGQLGLFSGVFETIQVMRDHDEDERAGVRTSAVALGLPRMKLVLRLMLVAAGAYAGIVYHPLLAIVPLLLAGTKIPEPAKMHFYWNRIRVGLGLVFLAECVWVWWTG